MKPAVASAPVKKKPLGKRGKLGGGAGAKGVAGKKKAPTRGGGAPKKQRLDVDQIMMVNCCLLVVVIIVVVVAPAAVVVVVIIVVVYCCCLLLLLLFTIVCMYVPLFLQNASTRSRRPFADLSGGMYSRDDFYTPTQCLGPGCIYESRPNSKYCSEECGIQLALE